MSKKRDTIIKETEMFKPQRVKFSVSEETIKSMAEEILMMGQQRRMKPHELIACFGLIADYLKKEVGIANVSIEKEDQP